MADLLSEEVLKFDLTIIIVNYNHISCNVLPCPLLNVLEHRATSDKNITIYIVSVHSEISHVKLCLHNLCVMCGISR